MRVITLAFLTLLLLVSGCRMFSPAEVPSDQKNTASYDKNTVDLLKSLGENDIKVIASALENVQDQGSVIFIDFKGWVHNPDGTVFIHPTTGLPLQISAKMIAKLNSLQALANLQGVKNLRWRVGGTPIEELPEQQKVVGIVPTLMDFNVGEIGVAGAVSIVPDARRAAAEERAAIYEGMAKLAAARGAAFATKVEALANGTVNVTTAVGEHILGRVLGTKPLEDTISGAKDVIVASIQTDDGIENVVAEGEGASVLKAAE